MKVTSASLTRRRTHGPYEHEEITLHAEIALDGNVLTQLNDLRSTAEIALYPENFATGKTSDVPSKTPETVVDKISGAEATINYGGVKSEVPGEVPPVIPKEEPKKRATRATKPKDTPAPVEAPSEEMEEVESPYKNTPATDTSEQDDTAGEDLLSEPAQPAAPAKGTVLYDKTVKEHRSRFATYLTTNHTGWQTKKAPEAIAAFSANLHGKPFEDSKGNMLDSFKAELKAFFG